MRSLRKPRQQCSPPARTWGFTLVEMMAVVTMIAMLAAIAIPLITRQLRDRRVQQAALNVASLYQSARMRAMGRGSAVLVRYTPGTRGRFDVYEAQRGSADSPNGLSPSGCAATPIPSCLTPDWNAAVGETYRRVTLLDLGQRSEYERVHIELKDEAGADVNTLDVCFTPMGRTFTRANFAQRLVPLTRAHSAQVYRGETAARLGRTREVLLLPNGAARLAL